jgi:hypothetical protein
MAQVHTELPYLGNVTRFPKSDFLKTGWLHWTRPGVCNVPYLWERGRGC